MQGLVDVFFTQGAAAAQAIEDFPKPVAKAFEHSRFPSRVMPGMWGWDRPKPNSTRGRYALSGVDRVPPRNASGSVLALSQSWPVYRGKGRQSQRKARLPGFRASGLVADFFEGKERR